MSLAGPALKDQLREMKPDEFEQFLAKLWEEDGWETRVTQSSRDAGVDVVAEREHPVEQKMVIQAKRYQKDNPVQSQDIQQYSALKAQENADIVAVVTTSSFTSDAKTRGEELDVRLVDGDGIVDMVRENKSDDLVEDHVVRSHGEVTSPTEFVRDIFIRIRLTRGLPYLAAIAGAIMILFAPLFGLFGQAWTDKILLLGWGLVPITSYIYSKAVPEATLSKGVLGGMILIPFIFGPYYLYREF